MKFGFPMAYVTTMLAWGGITWTRGYDNAGQTGYLKECIRWPVNYFIAAHTSKFEFVGQVISDEGKRVCIGRYSISNDCYVFQVGDGEADHAYWGRPEDMTMARPAYSITADGPGSDLAGETAAALAASSIFYTNMAETNLAADCLQHAKDLFEFADTYRGVYTDTIPAGAYYKSVAVVFVAVQL